MTVIVTNIRALGKRPLIVPTHSRILSRFFNRPRSIRSLEFLQCLGQPPPLTAANCPLLLAPRPASCQQIMNLLPLQQLHFDIGIAFQPLPAAAAKFLSELDSTRRVEWPADSAGRIGSGT